MEVDVTLAEAMLGSVISERVLTSAETPSPARPPPPPPPVEEEGAVGGLSDADTAELEPHSEPEDSDAAEFESESESESEEVAVDDSGDPVQNGASLSEPAADISEADPDSGGIDPDSAEPDPDSVGLDGDSVEADAADELDADAAHELDADAGDGLDADAAEEAGEVEQAEELETGGADADGLAASGPSGARGDGTWNADPELTDDEEVGTMAPSAVCGFVTM